VTTDAREPPPPGPPAARVAVLAAVVGAVAVAVRLWTLRDMEAANPLFRVTILDEAVYLREAGRIRDGLAPTTPSLVSLFWPWVLALAGAVERHGASLLNVGFGSATAVLACVGASRAAQSLLAGGVAGGIVALSGALVFQDCTAQIEPLLGLLVLAAVLALVAAARSPTHARIALAGLLVGVAGLGRGTNLALLLGLVPLLRGVPLRTAALRAVVAVAAAAVPIVAFDRAVGALPTSGGVNVWLGNNAWSRETRSFGTAEFPMDPDGEAQGVASIAEAAEGRKLSAAEINAWWARRALREIAAQPAHAIAHAGTKALLVVYPEDTGGNHDATAEREFSAYLRVVPVSFAWILVAGAAGWVAARRAIPGWSAAGLASVGFVATLVLIFPLTRYRVPLTPVAAVLAGVGVAALARRRVSAAEATQAGAVAALLAVASWAGLKVRPPTRPESWTNLGIASMESGVGDPAEWLRRAHAESPDFPLSAALLGVLSLQRNDPQQALTWFDRALDVARKDRMWDRVGRDAGVGKVRALSLLGRHREAIELHDRMRAVFPQDADIAADGVFVALHAGDRDGARLRLEAARAIAPSHPRVLEAARAVDEP
jgi:tetratricopeptide (TPR) repeat protein